MEASGSGSSLPSFAETVVAHNLPTSSKCFLDIPIDFMEDYGGRVNKFVYLERGLERSNGRSWHTSVVGNNWTGFRLYWEKFATDNGIAIGDFVQFTLVKSSRFAVQVNGEVGLGISCPSGKGTGPVSGTNLPRGPELTGRSDDKDSLLESRDLVRNGSGKAIGITTSTHPEPGKPTVGQISLDKSLNNHGSDVPTLSTPEKLESEAPQRKESLSGRPKRTLIIQESSDQDIADVDSREFWERANASRRKISFSSVGRVRSTQEDERVDASVPTRVLDEERVRKKHKLEYVEVKPEATEQDPLTEELLQALGTHALQYSKTPQQVLKVECDSEEELGVSNKSSDSMSNQDNVEEQHCSASESTCQESSENECTQEILCGASGPMNHLGRTPLTRNQRQKAMDAARGRNYTEPHVFITIAQQYESANLLKPPKLEYFKHLVDGKKPSFTLLDDAGITWVVQCHQDGTLGGGWEKFAYEHWVQEGDVFVFELLNANYRMLKAHIFRVAEIVEFHQRKVLKSKDNENTSPTPTSKQNSVDDRRGSAEPSHSEDLMDNNCGTTYQTQAELPEVDNSGRSQSPRISTLRRTTGASETLKRKPGLNDCEIPCSASLETVFRRGEENKKDKKASPRDDVGKGKRRLQKFRAEDAQPSRKAEKTVSSEVGPDSASDRLMYEVVSFNSYLPEWPETGTTRGDTYVSHRRPVTDAEREKVLLRARKCNLGDSPCFLVQLRKSGVYRGLVMSPPAAFAKDYLPRDSGRYKVNLMDDEGETWNATLYLGKLFWKNFTLDHYLEEDDVVVGELTDNRPASITFLFHIFRVVDINITERGKEGWNKHYTVVKGTKREWAKNRMKERQLEKAMAEKNRKRKAAVRSSTRTLQRKVAATLRSSSTRQKRKVSKEALVQSSTTADQPDAEPTGDSQIEVDAEEIEEYPVQKSTSMKQHTPTGTESKYNTTLGCEGEESPEETLRESAKMAVNSFGEGSEEDKSQVLCGLYLLSKPFDNAERDSKPMFREYVESHATITFGSHSLQANSFESDISLSFPNLLQAPMKAEPHEFISIL